MQTVKEAKVPVIKFTLNLVKIDLIYCAMKELSSLSDPVKIKEYLLTDNT